MTEFFYGEQKWVISFQVEALQGYRVIDIACGSGDAQTLCLTDDDTVWSWGDGDYGKLGRGGSDGCKVPMKVFLCNFFISLETMMLMENAEDRFVNMCKLSPLLGHQDSSCGS